MFARCKTESLYAFIRRGESVHGRLMTTIFVVTLGVVWLDPLHTLRLSICLLVTARIQDAQRHTEPYAINNTARPLSSVERKVLGGPARVTR